MLIFLLSFCFAEGGNSPIPVGETELSEDWDSGVVCRVVTEQDGAAAPPLEETVPLRQPASAHRSTPHRRPCSRLNPPRVSDISTLFSVALS